MKFSSLSTENQSRILSLEALKGPQRKKKARHGVQFKSDPHTNGPKSHHVNVWEFDVDSTTFNYGRYRLLRRQTGLDVTWYYATHVGENSFKYEVITDIG
jgi:hypothetical protein